MNVDDFLEKELAGLGIDNKEEAVDLPRKPEARVSNKVGLDRAEQDYMDFWQKIALHEVKWDKGSYDDIINMTKHFSSELNKGFQELKIKKETIISQAGRVRQMLKENKKEMAMKSFKEIQALADSIPGAFFEEKKNILDAVNDLAREVKQFNDNDAVKSAYFTLNQIGQLMDQTVRSISSSDMQGAISLYSKAIQSFVKLPEGFLMQKFQIGAKLLEIYKRLSIHNEISELQKHLTTQGTAQSVAQAPRESQQAPPASKSGQKGPISLRSLR